MVDQIRFFAGAARILEGRSAGEYMAGHTSFIRREPIGVIGQVAPWNYPMMMAVWKFAPAIAAGNAVVLKPSDTTPASTIRMAELIAESGALPPGVLNVICGDRDTGRALVEHPTLRRWSRSPARSEPACRSPAVGVEGPQEASTWSSAARRRSSSSTTRTSRPPPRPSPIAGYFNAGQDCTAATRVMVAPHLHDDFVAALSEQAKAGIVSTYDERPHRPGCVPAAGQQREPAGAGVRVHRPAARTMLVIGAGGSAHR